MKREASSDKEYSLLEQRHAAFLSTVPPEASKANALFEQLGKELSKVIIVDMLAAA